MAIYDPVMVDVNVLLVDRDANSLLETCNLLQINNYRVTAVQDAAIASSMLVQATYKYDIMMVDLNASDDASYKLLHDAALLRTTVIMMSDNVNPTLTNCPIEDGAFIFIKKPATMDFLAYLWQHVMREKTRKLKQKGKVVEENLTANFNDTIEYGPNDKRSKGIRIQENMFSESGNNAAGNNAALLRKPKLCTEWTLELHERFMDAVRYLGEGRCFPRDIMELMNVPGLTRMQVASHLQKCRFGWQPPEQGKPRRKAPKSSSSSGGGSSSNPKYKRYGLFPRQIRGQQPKEGENQSEEQLQDPSGSSDNMGSSAPPPVGMQNIQGALNIPASDNSTNNGNPGKQVAENANVVVPDQEFDMNAFDFAIDNDVDATGNKFNVQDTDWGQVNPEQVDNMAGDTEGFWSAWVASFARDP